MVVIFLLDLASRGSWSGCFRETDPREKFLISVHAGDGRRDDAFPGAGEFGGDEVADFFDGLFVEGGVAHDATAGDVLAAEFELRLDKADH